MNMQNPNFPPQPPQMPGADASPQLLGGADASPNFPVDSGMPPEQEAEFPASDEAELARVHLLNLIIGLATKPPANLNTDVMAQAISQLAAAYAQLKPDPQQQDGEQQLQLKREEMQANLEMKQQELELKREEIQMKLQAEQQKMAQDAQQHEQDMAHKAETNSFDLQSKAQGLQHQEETNKLKLSSQQEAHTQSMSLAAEKAKSKPKGE